MSDDIALLILCLVVAAYVVVGLAIYARHRRVSALRWAAKLLKKSAGDIAVKRKVLLQAEAWHPGDPKHAFMREFLNRRIEQYNRVADRWNEEVKS